MRRKQYPYDELENKWQSRWDAEKTYRTLNPGDDGFDPGKPKFYILDMFPYPSGAGLHVGHPEGYTATDIVARYRRKRGFNVLHPMGWDAFGLPAEQYAIKTGQHPRQTTEGNIGRFRGQLKRIGFSYDWDREVNTTDPGYYRWTQWIFLQLYNAWFDDATGKARPIAELEAAREESHPAEDAAARKEFIDSKRLAYVAEVRVNWCPELGTVLANEEVIDGKSEVGGFPVARRPMRQWMLRITAYAQRLIDELEDLDWPEGIKALQRNWIGRSEGADVVFKVAGSGEPITVYTTRPDTLFGATYMVLAPEHPLVDQVTTPAQQAAVEAYRQQISSKSDLERTELAKEKTGVFTGAHAVNPVNDEEVPIWIADYVLMTYGTGAIMAVPAHDERDFEFATKFGIPIVQVVSRSAGVPPATPFLDEHDDIIRHERRLPHWQQDDKTYFVTWRLADSLPEEKLSEWRDERDRWVEAHPGPWSDAEEAEYHERFSKAIDAWLDAGSGECILKQPGIGNIVANSLKHFDGERYEVYSFVVMPNHVHVLFRLMEGERLERVLQSWKSFTAKAINEKLGREGQVWQPEYWDRLIRDEKHFSNVREYIRRNPERGELSEGEYVLSTECAGGTPALLEAFTGDGVAINSPLFDGLPTPEAKAMISSWLEEKGLGKKTINYKLHDWLFSRQRYWGEPFPIVWDETGHRALPEAELPVTSPEMDDFKPTGTPEPPLTKAVDWVRYSESARRETNTMPQWAGSCWYYLRFIDPANGEALADREAESYWMGADSGKAGGVDLYVGGTEHAVLHLLYARFWHKVLNDLGHVSTPEPFHRLVNQGLILGEDGQKMSKSRGNVVNPDDVIDDYGADSLRLFEMFMGPLEQVKPWSTKGVEGVHRFLGRVWRLFMDTDQEGNWAVSEKVQDVEPGKAHLRALHETIKKVTEDTEALAFNTAISQMMICVNELTQAEVRPAGVLAKFLELLYPYAPHISEELWDRLQDRFQSWHDRKLLLSELPWPEYEESYLVTDEVEMVVQVNGKLRDKILVGVDAPKEEIEAQTLASEKVKKFTDGCTIRKVIVVPGRLVNIVAN